LVPY